MLTSPSKLTHWQFGGASVLGASHVRQGAPNQDAIAWWPESGQGLPLILAIADGHGSAKSFRSQQGSALAVQVAISVLTRHLQLDQPQRLQARSRNLQQFEQTLQQELPQQLVQTWQDQVLADLEQHPFTPAELQKLQTKDGESACERVHQNPLLAYGATLLTVVVTPQFILYLQLGDGDILCVDAQGQPQRPLPVDPNLIANETTSLCMPHAWDWLRLTLTPTQSAPQLILVSTDGYSNSFVSEADFCQVGPDYWQMLQEQGFAEVLSQLPIILQETSQQGSGDDITLGLIVRNTTPPSDQGQRGASTLIQSTRNPGQPNQGSKTHTSQLKPTPPAAAHGYVPGQTRLSATSANRSKTASQLGSTTQFQSPSSPIAPAPMASETPLASTSAREVSPGSLEPQLQQANQKLRRQVQQLRLGLFVCLGVTVLSLGLAAFALWQAKESLFPRLFPGAPDSSPTRPNSPDGSAPDNSNPNPPSSASPKPAESPAETDAGSSRQNRRPPGFPPPILDQGQTNPPGPTPQESALPEPSDSPSPI
jgi:hypothetical protein